MLSIIRLITMAGLLLGVPDSLSAQVRKALPVDPSEITPDAGIKPLEPETAPPAEAKPLAPGEVVLEAPKKNPRADTPAIENLPTGDDAVRLQIFLDDRQGLKVGIGIGGPHINGKFTVIRDNIMLGTTVYHRCRHFYWAKEFGLLIESIVLKPVDIFEGNV